MFKLQQQQKIKTITNERFIFILFLNNFLLLNSYKSERTHKFNEILTFCNKFLSFSNHHEFPFFSELISS